MRSCRRSSRYSDERDRERCVSRVRYDFTHEQMNPITKSKTLADVKYEIRGQLARRAAELEKTWIRNRFPQHW